MRAQNNQTLYQLQANYQQLLDKDVLDHDDLQRLDELPGLMEDKLIQRAYLVKNLEYLIASINCELEHILKRRDRLQANMESLQQSILESMQLTHLAKITKCPYFEIAVHKKKPKVDDYDRKAIPDEYWYTTEPKVEIKLDKERLHDDLAAGKDIPGARLIDPVKLVIK